MFDDLQLRFRRAFQQRVRAKPTRDGFWMVLLLLGTMIAAVNTGNNLVYLCLGLMCGMLVVSNALAEWNLRGVWVSRRLPTEAFAEEPALGAIVVKNRRRVGTAFSIVVEEVAGADAIGVAAWIPPQQSVAVPIRWVFPVRGEASLRAIRVSSTFPFGWVRRSREVLAPAEVLVFPKRKPGPNARSAAHHGQARQDHRRVGHGEDFYGMREYQSGDAPKRIHWPTSARVGKPMIVERVAEAADEVMVAVDPARGNLFEDNLSRACGQIVRHFDWGHAVGLEFEGVRLPPAVGAEWRRGLLVRLAKAEPR